MTYGVIYFPKGPKASDYVASYDGWECICLPTSTKIDKDTLIACTWRPSCLRTSTLSKDVGKSSPTNTARLCGTRIPGGAAGHQTNSKFRLIYAIANFSNWRETVCPTSPNELATGDKTAAQVVAQVKQPLQAYLDDNYNK